jgi:hypothetical protein
MFVGRHAEVGIDEVIVCRPPVATVRRLEAVAPEARSTMERIVAERLTERRT